MIKRHGAASIRQNSTDIPRRPSPAASRSSLSLPSRGELYKQGKRLRDKSPRQSHALWEAPPHRPDPLSLLEKSCQGRIPEVKLSPAQRLPWLSTIILPGAFKSPPENRSGNTQALGAQVR